MKYIVVSLFLLGLMLCLCLYSSSQVAQAVQETTQLLEKAVTAEKNGDKETSLHLVRAACDTWRSHETFFGTVLRHDEIDDVTGEFARLVSYASTQDQDDFLSNCAALLAQLEHITEMEKPSFSNIM